MEHPIVHILGIAPYEGMKTAMERAAESYPGVQLDAFVGDLEQGVEIVKNSPKNTYDCIISRGGTAEMIRGITDIPVVDIELSVYDVLRAIKLVENYSKLYAIVGFPSITEPAHTLCDLLRYDLDILTVHSVAEVQTTLTRLQQGGYRMVVSDMVTHDMARKLGMDAFLIGSGVESLHAAFDQALLLSAGYRRLRRENHFMRSILEKDEGCTTVLNEYGTVSFCVSAEPSSELLTLLRAKMRELHGSGQLKFYYNDKGTLHNILAREVTFGAERYYLFRDQTAQIPLRSNKYGIRSFGKSECEHLFTSSFYSISGAMGELEASLTSIAATRQPVLILGEHGTGKEQIARALYLRSPLANRPFVVVDCALINDRSWDFLLNHYNSPLNDTGNTLYLQQLEALSPARAQELLAVMLETGFTGRQRVILSCSCRDGSPLHESGQLFAARLGCLSLQLQPLRARSDEIPSLASLYLGSLNMELGKQISGFDSHAIEQLRQYDWPNNYTQFKQVLNELATLAASPYIRSSAVAEVLSKERSLTRGNALAPTVPVGAGRTLEQITCDAIREALAAADGNQSAAAKALGISRTTLWRYLNSAAMNETTPKLSAHNAVLTARALLR